MAMTPTILTPTVARLLDTLYADAAANDPRHHQAAKYSGAAGPGFYHAMRHAYMPVSREFGNLLYILTRTARARMIVEFGTSFGISTIFLAAAARDNGAGTVITTEFNFEKAERARRNLAAAGLEKYVEFRVGDARETLTPAPRDIDLIFLDGPKDLYLDVLKILESSLRPQGIVASDNTDHDDLKPFLDHVRDARSGYTSSALLTGDGSRGHEVSIRD